MGIRLLDSPPTSCVVQSTNLLAYALPVTGFTVSRGHTLLFLFFKRQCICLLEKHRCVRVSVFGCSHARVAQMLAPHTLSVNVKRE